MTPLGGIVSGGSVELPLPEKDCPVDEGATVVVSVTVRGFAFRAHTFLPWTTRQCPGFSQIVRATT